MKLSPEEMQALLEETQAKLREAESKAEALERTRTGLLSDLQKRKAVERLARAAGIDMAADDFEDRVAEVLAASSASGAPGAPAAPPTTAATSTAATAGASAAAPGGAFSDGSGAGPATPSSAVEEALKAQLASVQRQLDQMNKKLIQTEKEKEEERRARLDEYKRSIVMSELEKAGCKRPAHVYALQGSSFRLLDDGQTVVYGSEENPVNVQDAISNLEKDEEYSIYFPGIIASGSGLPTSRSSMPGGENPFTKSGSNATKASEIIARDKMLAQRLVQQARARGDVDQVLANAAYR